MGRAEKNRLRSTKFSASNFFKLGEFSRQSDFPDAVPTAAAAPKKKMASPSHIRSLYRSILREIPHRPLSTPPSQIQQRIRSSFSSPSPSRSPLAPLATPPDGSSNHHHTSAAVTQQVAEGEEYLRYVTAQRMYTVLLERYNPGIGSIMDEDERTRLTARRVGINLPEKYDSTSSR